MGMYLLYICIGDLKHLSQKCSKQLSWQGFAVPPSEKEGKPQWESIPVLSTLLAKGTQTPLALDTERREDAKEDASTTKVKADGSQLLLDLNIGLLFEKVSYVGYWKKKQPPKIPSETPHPRTKPLLCSSDMKIAVLRQASHRARHCKDGTQLWRQVLSRGTKNESHLFSFACEKSRKFINIMKNPRELTIQEGLLTSTQFLKMLHFFSSINMRQVARIIPFHSRGGEKTIIQENPAPPSPPTPFEKLVSKYWWCWDACRSILVPCVHHPLSLWHQPPCPRPVKCWRNHTLTQNCRIYFPVGSLFKKNLR